MRSIQRTLNAAGANPPLAEDGVFGPRTDAAVRSFQRKQGIQVDGIVGDQTRGKLAPFSAATSDGFGRTRGRAKRAPVHGSATTEWAHSAARLAGEDRYRRAQRRRSGDNAPAGNVPRAGGASAPRAPQPVAASSPTAAPGGAEGPRVRATRRAGRSAQSQVVDQVRGRVPSAERAGYDRVRGAIDGAESGGREVYSGLRTTAGARASFGRGQLTIREHLNGARKLNNGQLAALGTSRAEIDKARGNGQAAESWYRVMHKSRGHARHARKLGLSAGERGDLQRMVKARDWAGVQSRFGDRFAQGTGIPAGEIQGMAQTSLLKDKSVRDEFRKVFQEVNGHKFNPGRRRNAELAKASEEMVRRHPELQPVLQRLGGSHTSMGYYLGRGNTAEIMHGWYARGTEAALGKSRAHGLIKDLNPVTTELRHVSNYRKATAAVAQSGLTGADRSRAIGRIARQFHGAPGSARRRFFDKGKPRATSPAELQQLLDRHYSSTNRRQSDKLFLRHYD